MPLRCSGAVERAIAADPIGFESEFLQLAGEDLSVVNSVALVVREDSSPGAMPNHKERRALSIRLWEHVVARAKLSGTADDREECVAATVYLILECMNRQDLNEATRRYSGLQAMLKDDPSLYESMPALSRADHAILSAVAQRLPTE